MTTPLLPAAATPAASAHLHGGLREGSVTGSGAGTIVGQQAHPHAAVTRRRLALIARGRRVRLVSTTAVVFALVGVNLANHLLGWDTMWLGPVGAVTLLAFARWQGLTWHQLGLARHTHARGLP